MGDDSWKTEAIQRMLRKARKRSKTKHALRKKTLRRLRKQGYSYEAAGAIVKLADE